jgi:hypothetical protein
VGPRSPSCLETSAPRPAAQTPQNHNHTTRISELSDSMGTIHDTCHENMIDCLHLHVSSWPSISVGREHATLLNVQHLLQSLVDLTIWQQMTAWTNKAHPTARRTTANDSDCEVNDVDETKVNCYLIRGDLIMQTIAPTCRRYMVVLHESTGMRFNNAMAKDTHYLSTFQLSKATIH